MIGRLNIRPLLRKLCLKKWFHIIYFEHNSLNNDMIFNLFEVLKSSHNMRITGDDRSWLGSTGDEIEQLCIKPNGFLLSITNSYFMERKKSQDPPNKILIYVQFKLIYDVSIKISVLLQMKQTTLMLRVIFICGKLLFRLLEIHNGWNTPWIEHGRSQCEFSESNLWRRFCGFHISGLVLHNV